MHTNTLSSHSPPHRTHFSLLSVLGDGPLRHDTLVVGHSGSHTPLGCIRLIPLPVSAGGMHVTWLGEHPGGEAWVAHHGTLR